MRKKHLTDESKEQIKHSVQQDDDGVPIFDEKIGRGILDIVNILLYTVIKHFIVAPINITARIHD